MSAITKSIPKRARRVERRHHQGAGRRATDADVAQLAEKIRNLKAENKRSSKENAKLAKEVELWFSEAERFEELKNHWEKRYFCRDQEAIELAGQLSLRDKQIAELQKREARKDARIKELLAKLTNNLPSSEIGPINKSGKNQRRENQGKRKRGRQEGAPGHGRQNHDHLPVDDEVETDLADPEKLCPKCGEQLNEVGSEDSEVVEIEVKGYRRKIRRKKYGHDCKTEGRWLTKTAPSAPKIWPRAAFGISIWVFLLIGKFVLQMPIHRVCMQLLMVGIKISEGTVVAGFARIEKLIDPLIDEIQRYSREEKTHWHIDDTGWKVFIVIDGKSGFGWYLWVFLSNDVCVYVISPSRGRKVPQSHLKDSSGVVTSDRLGSNMKLGDNVDNSYCWVHIRRELRELATAHPEITEICENFLNLIGLLYHYNKDRLLSENGSTSYLEAQEKLRETLDQIEKDCRSHLSDASLHPELQRLFTGVLKDWNGLMLFLDIAAIPPDNNPAERALRGPVVGRKNYNGSCSQESARFTAKMFTLCETLKLNNIDSKQFLTKYFTACANNGGKPPQNAIDFLPWKKKPAQPEIPP
jgi:transposase